MINSVVLIGRLTRDIEVRYTSNEKAIGNFTIAVQRTYKNENGETEADFINCTIFGKMAEVMQKYTHKGDLIGVDGRMQNRSYETKEGQKVNVTEVLVNNISFINIKKQEENPYKDMKVKVEADQNIQYEESQLPF